MEKIFIWEKGEEEPSTNVGMIVTTHLKTLFDLEYH